MNINMRALLLLSLFILASIQIIGCSIPSQADITTKASETQPVLLTTIPATNNNPATFSISALTIEPRAPATDAFFKISVTVKIQETVRVTMMQSFTLMRYR